MLAADRPLPDGAAQRSAREVQPLALAALRIHLHTQEQLIEDLVGLNPGDGFQHGPRVRHVREPFAVLVGMGGEGGHGLRLQGSHDGQGLREPGHERIGRAIDLLQVHVQQGGVPLVGVDDRRLPLGGVGLLRLRFHPGEQIERRHGEKFGGCLFGGRIIQAMGVVGAAVRLDDVAD